MGNSYACRACMPAGVQASAYTCCERLLPWDLNNVTPGTPLPAGDEFISGLDEAWAAAGGDESGQLGRAVVLCLLGAQING